MIVSPALPLSTPRPPAGGVGVPYGFKMNFSRCWGREDKMTASIDFERERPFAVDEHRHEDAANAIVFVWHRGRAPGAGDFIIVWPRRSREHFTIDWMRADLCRIDLDCLDRSIFRIFVSLEERNHYAVADIAPIGIIADEP